MIQTYDKAALPANPYPETWTTLSDFRFQSALSLIRPVNAARERMGEDGDYILQHDLLAEITVDGEPRLLQAPRGMVTDLTSVPPAGRVLISRVGPWLEAAILHDYLYIAWQDIAGFQPTEQDRLFADEVFRLAMKDAAVAKWRRDLIYRFVRGYGEKSFTKQWENRYADLDDPALVGRLAFVVPTERDLA